MEKVTIKVLGAGGGGGGGFAAAAVAAESTRNRSCAAEDFLFLITNKIELNMLWCEQCTHSNMERSVKVFRTLEVSLTVGL